MKPNDRFVIRLLNVAGQFTDQFIGYIQSKVVKNPLGPEYVLVKGSKNKDEAVVFTYVKSIPSFPIGPSESNIESINPFFKVELPYSGEYYAFVGQGDEFNALKVGTTEYKASRYWKVKSSSEIPLYDNDYRPEIRGVFIGVLTKPIRGGAHGRTINSGQLRFGQIGSPSAVKFQFEKI